jgi:hypothetical protein
MMLTTLKQQLKVKRKTNKIAILICLFLLALHTLWAQVVSPFNKLLISDTLVNYSFIVSGHFHGASTNISTYPASTLLANIDTLNKLKPSFLVSLGDLFLDVNNIYIDHYQKSLFNKLQMPLFNAVGNHDLSNGNIYETMFGPTFYSFTLRSELFIVLNTELNDGSIKDKQLTFLKDVLNKTKNSNIKNIFIFSHRPVWAEQIDKYKSLFKGNTRTSFGQANFLEKVYPLLKNIPDNKKIYWISGSMGGGPASFFYDTDEKTNVTFIQSAIRDLPYDAILKVNSESGKISFEGISLTGQLVEPVENYNMDYWTNTTGPQEKINFRLLPYLLFQMLKHYYFWIGFACSTFLILLLAFIKKRWTKRK